MKLFTFATSPYARKVRMMLELKKVDFEPVERCYSLDRKDDLLAASARDEAAAAGRRIDDDWALKPLSLVPWIHRQAARACELRVGGGAAIARIPGAEGACNQRFSAGFEITGPNGVGGHVRDVNGGA